MAVSVLSDESSLKSSKYLRLIKCIFTWTCAFLCCFLLVSIIGTGYSLLYPSNRTDIASLLKLGHSARNDDPYLSNSDYYQQLPGIQQFTQLDNLRLDRLSSPRFHRTNGKSVMYLRTQYHMPDLIGSTTTLHWVDIETNKTIQLTQPIWNIHDQEFEWIEDNVVLFLSNRGKSGLTQLFQLNLPSNISATSGFIEPIQITDLPMSINDLLVDRQATHLAFSCQVYPNLSIEETASRQADENANHGSVYKFDKLFIRQSNGFIHGLRLHPFVAEIRKNSNGIYNFVNKPRDLLFNIDSDSSITTFSNGQRQWSFSASGKKFAFVRRNDQTSEVAWTTNYNIFMIDLTNPHSQPICITENNLAVDAHPRYSPIDEDVLLYLAQSVPGYTPDQYKIKLYNGSTTITLLDNWDRNIGAVTWSPDGQSIFLELAEQAHNVIYKITGIFSPLPFLDRLISVGSSYDVNIHPTNDEMFLFMHSSITEPPNIYLFSSARQMKPMTNHNTNWMNKVRISKAVEKFHFIGALNETVWGWHVAPVNGTDQKAPLAFLIHGGPYSAECDEWSYGWSYQLFASQGYAVIAINFHGSTSYGQKFTDSVTGQFGSLPFEDLKLGLTAALTRYPYIDGNRAVAIGGSYGGYMVNWIAGHPEMSQRFKALISDAGIFNLKELAYSVDELSFTEASVGGFTPYENPDAFERFNPANHVANWTQPMLIIHGRDDYRVPDTQGISAFTALQRRGIPSRLVYFPKEGHSIGNRFNSIVKCQEILDWMNRWTA